MKKILVVFVVYLCISNLVFADEIITTSGNHYFGKITNVEEQSLELETEDSIIELEREKIESITSNDGKVIYQKPEKEEPVNEEPAINDKKLSEQNKDQIKANDNNAYDLVIRPIEEKLSIKSNGNIDERLTVLENKVFGESYVDERDFRINRLLNYLEKNKPVKPQIEANKVESLPVHNKVNTQQTVEYPAVVLNRKQCKLPYNYLPFYGDYFSTRSTVGMAEYRWYKCPITISLDSVPLEYKDTAKKAVEKWAKYVPLQIINSPQADIVFKWEKRSEVKKITRSKRVIGLAQHTFPGHHVCVIHVLKRRKYPETQLEHTIMHELGHAFGLGHSNNKKDLMYPINNARKGGVSDWLITNVSFVPIIVPVGFRKAVKATLEISPRDTNTLWKIYSVNKVTSDGHSW